MRGRQVFTPIRRSDQNLSFFGRSTREHIWTVRYTMYKEMAIFPWFISMSFDSYLRSWRFLLETAFRSFRAYPVPRQIMTTKRVIYTARSSCTLLYRKTIPDISLLFKEEEIRISSLIAPPPKKKKKRKKKKKGWW